jgi:hypothetical protein
MDNSNIDKLTKKILADSKLELANPDFNHLVMNKIRFEKRKKSIFHNVGLFFFIFITFDLLILSLLKILSINITGLSLKTGSLIHRILFSPQNGLSNPGQLLFTYLLVLGIVVFALNRLLSSRYKYSGL